MTETALTKSELNAGLEAARAEFQQSISALTRSAQQQESMGQRLGAFDAAVNERLAQIESSLVQISGRLDRLEERATSLGTYETDSGQSN